MRSFIPTDELKTRRRDGIDCAPGLAGATKNYIISGMAGFFDGRYNAFLQLNSL
jgi:hypothetical protein